MRFQRASRLPTEPERLEAIYDVYDEDSRLDSKSTNVEFVTTMHYVESRLDSAKSILDLGAATGKYSLHLAALGHHVTAVEPVVKHVRALRAAAADRPNLAIVHADAVSALAMYPDNTFDCILCLGPLYHIEKESGRRQCVREVLRTCKSGGSMYFAMINNDMVIVTQEFVKSPGFLLHGRYDMDSFRVDDFPFVFHTVEQARKLLTSEGVLITREIAADGLNELLSERIDAMDDETYQQWLRFHFYTCEKPEHLGASIHLLFECVK